MEEYNRINFVNDFIDGQIWLLGLSFVLVLGCGIVLYAARSGHSKKKYLNIDKASIISMAGFSLSVIMVTVSLASAYYGSISDQVKFRKNLVEEKYNLELIDDDYLRFEKVTDSLFIGKGEFYSPDDKKFYMYDYVFDSEGIFLEEPKKGTAVSKNPELFLKK